MLIPSRKRSTLFEKVPTAIRRRCSRRVEVRRGSSDMKHRLATLESILGSQRQWPTFRLMAGRKASSASSMRKARTLWSFIRNPRLSWSVGRAKRLASFNMTTQPLRLDMKPQVECAETLASHFYTDPAVLVSEKKKVFLRTWQLVGTLGQPCGEVNGVQRTIADPESFFTVDVVGEPVVITRDKSGTL